MAAFRKLIFMHILQLMHANILQIGGNLASFREGICII